MAESPDKRDEQAPTPRTDAFFISSDGMPDLGRPENEILSFVRQLERELADWKDRAERVIKERDRLGRELAEMTRKAELAVMNRIGDLAVSAIQETPCEHDWHIWPETDGQEQRCAKCKAYRATPEEDKFWKKAAATSSEKVCDVCGGRASVCKVLGHRPESDRHIQWKAPSSSERRMDEIRSQIAPDDERLEG